MKYIYFFSLCTILTSVVRMLRFLYKPCVKATTQQIQHIHETKNSLLLFVRGSFRLFVRWAVKCLIIRTTSRNYATGMVMVLVPFSKLSIWHLDQLVAPRPII